MPRSLCLNVLIGISLLTCPLQASSQEPLRVGIICALPSELGQLADEMEIPFISGTADRNALKAAIPSLLAVDIEGSAVAQVCYEHEIPSVVIRAISDSCDEDAAIDCMQFLREAAPVYTTCFEIVLNGDRFLGLAKGGSRRQPYGLFRLSTNLGTKR